MASLSAALVRSDDAGSIRMVKDGSNNTGRDDVAAALTLAAGAWERSLAGPSPPAIPIPRAGGMSWRDRDRPIDRRLWARSRRAAFERDGWRCLQKVRPSGTPRGAPRAAPGARRRTLRPG